MYRLNVLLEGVKRKQVLGTWVEKVRNWTVDSRDVQPGDMFIAIRGTRVDGHQFIPDAIQKGARVILCEQIPEENPPSSRQVLWIEVEDSRRAWAQICRNGYGQPDQNIRLVGITGTNGKTSTVWFIYQALEKLGVPAGIFTTIWYGWKDYREKAPLTTPDPERFYSLLRKMKEEGKVQVVVLEASSHALAQKRLDASGLDIGGFLNLTHDHLDYHRTWTEYRNAKFRIADLVRLRNGTLLMNVDDEQGRLLLQRVASDPSISVVSCGMRVPAQIQGKILEADLNFLHMEIEGIPVSFSVTGEFQAVNLLMAYACLYTLLQSEEIPSREILQALSSVTSPPGRMEMVVQAPVRILVDYAHTPDALHRVLTELRKYRKEGRLITVAGCGGNRDTAKRPQMGEVLATLSDIAIFTSDNPRYEDPEKILQDMLKGVRGTPVHVRVDRRQAIQLAIHLAEPGDIILIAGKGHETYQEIQGRRVPFDDREIARELAREKFGNNAVLSVPMAG